MKIRTKLRLNTYISAGLFIIMLAVSAWSFFNSSRIYRDLELVDELRRVAAERIMLRDDYLLHREERAKIQWQAKSETLRGLLDLADTRFSQREDKSLLTEARKAFEATFTSFSMFLEKYQRREHAKDKTLDFTDADARLINQVFLQAYVLDDSIMQLNRTTQNKAKTAREGRVLFVALFVMGGVLVVIFNTTFINFLLRRKIAALSSGMDIIGNGNLDYHIDTKGNDELADLAQASNEMAKSLKKSYISVENLQKEISERKRVEDALRKSEAQQSFAMETSHIGVWDLDLVDHSAFRSLEHDRIFGYADLLPDWTYEMFLEHVLPEDRAIVDRQFQEAIKNQNDWNFECRIRRIDGEVRWIWAAGCHQVDSSGATHRMAGIVQDITERKQVEFQREAALEEIKTLNEELEKRVAQRTAELIVKTTELERINKVFVDRELRMRELKEKIAELEKK
jgi:PAS domain S-box-containing protein